MSLDAVALDHAHSSVTHLLPSQRPPLSVSPSGLVAFSDGADVRLTRWDSDDGFSAQQVVPATHSTGRVLALAADAALPTSLVVLRADGAEILSSPMIDARVGSAAPTHGARRAIARSDPANPWHAAAFSPHRAGSAPSRLYLAVGRRGEVALVGRDDSVASPCLLRDPHSDQMGHASCPSVRAMAWCCGEDADHLGVCWSDGTVDVLEFQIGSENSVAVHRSVLLGPGGPVRCLGVVPGVGFVGTREAVVAAWEPGVRGIEAAGTAGDGSDAQGSNGDGGGVVDLRGMHGVDPRGAPDIPPAFLLRGSESAGVAAQMRPEVFLHLRLNSNSSSNAARAGPGATAMSLPLPVAFPDLLATAEDIACVSSSTAPAAVHLFRCTVAGLMTLGCVSLALPSPTGSRLTGLAARMVRPDTSRVAGSLHLVTLSVTTAEAGDSMPGIVGAALSRKPRPAEVTLSHHAVRGVTITGTAATSSLAAAVEEGLRNNMGPIDILALMGRGGGGQGRRPTGDDVSEATTSGVLAETADRRMGRDRETRAGALSPRRGGPETPGKGEGPGPQTRQRAGSDPSPGLDNDALPGSVQATLCALQGQLLDHQRDLLRASEAQARDHARLMDRMLEEVAAARKERASMSAAIVALARAVDGLADRLGTRQGGV